MDVDQRRKPQRFSIGAPRPELCALMLDVLREHATEGPPELSSDHRAVPDEDVT